MGLRIALVFLLLLGSSSRVLSALRTSEMNVLASKVGMERNVCSLCEEITTEALNYLGNSNTQREIMGILHKSCSRLGSFKEQCTTMVDYYASLLFLEISSIQPGELCQKVDLCEQVVSIFQQFSDDTCGFCHHAIAEALLKLKDPDTQIEVLHFLLKGCEAIENLTTKCKRLVFEYAPIILVNAEKFLENNDICKALHLCDSHRGTVTQEFTADATSMVDTY